MLTKERESQVEHKLNKQNNLLEQVRNNFNDLKTEKDALTGKLVD